MKRKKITLVISTVVIATLTIIAIWNYTGSNTQDKNAQATPAVNTASPQVQSPTPFTSPVQTNVPEGTINDSENYKTGTVKDFSITFKTPEDWKKISGYDNRYEGKSGFMEMTALSGYGLSLKEAVDLQINHELKPFGDKPEIRNITIDSQEASIILPANNTDSNAQAAILVKFPKPVTISATPYNYLIIWADKGHIIKIANEIKFIK